MQTDKNLSNCCAEFVLHLLNALVTEEPSVHRQSIHYVVEVGNLARLVSTLANLRFPQLLLRW